MNTAMPLNKENFVATQKTKSLRTTIPLDPTFINGGEEWFVRRFEEHVIGQPEALQVALQAYNAAHNPLRDLSRPIGIYLLIGPSRTGKTLTAETLALLMHGNKNAMVRLQGGDYRQEHQMLDLKGAPPSYIGYKDPADEKEKLAPSDIDPTSVISNHNLNRVRMGSDSQVNIILIDESEKACSEFFKLWMGIFDTGVLRLGNGEMVDFTNTIFIMTSNLGMAEVEKLARGGIGFTNTARDVTRQDVQSTVVRALSLVYPPEFRNRLDAVVIFQPLSHGDMRKIVQHEIDLVQKRIYKQLEQNRQFMLQVSEEAQDFLLQEALSSNKSIAELKRVLGRRIIMPLGRELERGSIQEGDVVRVSLEAGARLLFAIERGACDEDAMQARLAAQSDSFRFRLRRARQIVELMLSEGHQLSLYSMRLQCQSKAELDDQFRLMSKELEQVFAVANLRERATGEGEVILTFRTVEDMALLLNEYYRQTPAARI